MKSQGKKTILINCLGNLRGKFHLFAWEAYYRLVILQDRGKNEGNPLKKTVKDKNKGERMMKIFWKTNFKIGIKGPERWATII